MELNHVIIELCKHAKTFKQYDGAVYVDPDSQLSNYCRVRARWAAVEMVKGIEQLASIMDKSETIRDKGVAA